MTAICVLTIKLPKTIINFSWEVKTKIIDCLTLKHLLWLIEFRSKQSFEVIIQHKVLKLSKLHGHQLLLNLSMDVVGLGIFEITLHVNLLFKLGTDQKDELFVSVGVDQELLITELEEIGVLMIDVRDVLIFYVDTNEIIFRIIDPTNVAIFRKLRFINKLNRISERFSIRTFERCSGWSYWLFFERCFSTSSRLSHCSIDCLCLWLLHNQTTPFNDSIFVKVWEEIQILEAFLSSQLSNLTQKHLFSTNKLNMIGSSSSILD